MNTGKNNTINVRINPLGNPVLKVLMFFFSLQLGFLIYASDLFAGSTGLQRLHGHYREEWKKYPTVGRLKSDKYIHLAIGLPLRNVDALKRQINDIYDPKSPNHRHYLTPSEFTILYGPSASDYENVISFTRSHGLKVTRTYSNRLVVDVSGKVSDIETMLNINFDEHQRGDGSRFYGPDREPSVNIETPIGYISGLDNFSIPKPLSHAISLKKISALMKERTSDSKSFYGSGPTPAPGYPQLYWGNDFRAAYANGVASTGSGQSVGLLEFDGYSQADINSYETQSLGLGSYPPLINVLLDGFPGTVGFNNVEVALDIEMAISMAPSLNSVVVYEGTNGDDILNAMAAPQPAEGAPLCMELSSSWGEFAPKSDTTMSSILMEMAAQGQSFFQAAGDSGAYIYQYGASVLPYDPGDIRDEDYVTVVGGTFLYMNGVGSSWQGETSWDYQFAQGSGGGGFCNGTSDVFESATPNPTFVSTPVPIPTYQAHINMTTNGGSTAYRNLPDVSMVADYICSVATTFSGIGTTTPTPVPQVFTPGGGTSYAAPLWAAYIALVNQQATQNGKGTIGFANPTLYKIAASPTPYFKNFHDIKDGSVNGSAFLLPSNEGFGAVAGYDLATGLGSPNGTLVSALVTYVPTVTKTITPTITRTKTKTPTITRTPTKTWTPTKTLTPRFSYTPTSTPTPYFSPTPTLGVCSSGQPGNAWTPVATGTPVGATGEEGLIFDAGLGPEMWNVSSTGVWASTDGQSWSLKSSPSFLSNLTGQQAVSMAGKIWVVDGPNAAVWSSPDGVNWSETTSSAAFGVRSGCSVLAYNGKIWVIAGYHSGTFLNDVWYSTDGVSWSEATSSAAFPGREVVPSVVFNNKMFIIGGETPTRPSNDIWESTDGVTWSQVTPVGSVFDARYLHQVVVCGNAMWVIGGLLYSPFGGTEVHDTWVTQDGAHWTETNTSNPFSISSGTAFSFASSVWALTQSGSGTWVWNSGCCLLPTFTPTPTPTFTATLGVCSSGQPGNAWTPVATGTPVGATGEEGLIFDAGLGPEMWSVSSTGVWASTDGTNWTLMSSPTFLSDLTGQQAVSWNGKIWAVDGTNAAVWSSPDGVNWTEVTSSASFGSRGGCSVLAYNGKLWVIAGYHSGLLNDVWYSSDGSSWTEATASAAFSPRSGVPSVVFNGQMYLVGGGTASLPANDVWTSTDGSTWTQITAVGTTFAGRIYHQVVVCGNAVWVIGGETYNGHGVSPVYDTWVSLDGAHWAQTNSSNPFDISSGTAFSFASSVWALTQSNSGTWAWKSSCCLLPTPTPGGPGGMFRSAGVTIGNGDTATPTPSPTPTVTVTPSPTPTAVPEDEVSVVAEPNLSNGGQPIRFEVELGQAAQVHLILYTLAGEKVYEMKAAGTAGINDLDWSLRNTANAGVASGLYLYAVEVTNRNLNYVKKGQVVVLH